ncbi:MAG: apolipoprotein N-acyltransferase [Pararhodobacter sp.]|nr:apolipoprotein N-acyltransferase [Pararhodobacter sp.]
MALLAAGAGALGAAGQAPLGLWPLALGGLAGLVWLVSRAPGPGRAAWLAWVGGGGHFAAALFWIVEPFFVDPLRHGWMAPLALPALALGLALFWALAGWLAGRLATGAGSRALGFATALAAAELARGHVLTGFPWAQPGHIWLDTGVMQLAAVVGASGLTAGTLWLAALPALAWSRGAVWRAGAAALGLAVVALGWAWGAARAPAPMPEGTPVVRLIQPNVPQHLKWHPDLMQRWFDRQMDFTAAAPVAGAARPDLVIWPETAIHWLLDDAWPALAAIAAAADGAQVALGAQRAERAGSGGVVRYFNSLALIDPAGAVTQVYDKHHLVPFGEYIPFSEWLMGTPLGGLAGRSLLGFSPGPGPVVWDLGALGRVAPQICYETVFPRHLHLSPRPDWVLQVTNDAWFGAISGPYQHLAQARFRAVEFGLPVVRVANTGVSAVIDARGGLVAALALNTEGWADVALPGPLPATIFARRGETPLAALLIVVLVLLLRNRLRRRH